MSNPRLMMWEPINLFGEDVDDDIDEIEEDDDDKSYLDKEKEDMVHKLNIVSPKLNKIVQTPLGLFLSDNTFHPLRGLNVYLVHVNFPITEKIIKALDSVEGLEAFKQVGRYRMVFIIGAMFSDDEVQDKIHEVCEVDNDIEIESDEDDDNENLRTLFQKTVSKLISSDYWISYIFPNGKYMFENLENESELSLKYNEYSEIKKISGGVIYTSNKVE